MNFTLNAAFFEALLVKPYILKPINHFNLNG